MGFRKIYHKVGKDHLIQLHRHTGSGYQQRDLSNVRSESLCAEVLCDELGSGAKDLLSMLIVSVNATNILDISGATAVIKILAKLAGVVRLFD